MNTETLSERMERIEFVQRYRDPVDVGKPVGGGERACQRRLHGRLIQDGERTYHAYSADELFELDNLVHHGRPGHQY